MPEAKDGTVDLDELASIYRTVLSKLAESSQSFSHPLGFTTLLETWDPDGDGYERLHLWRRDSAIEQLPHSHSSHLRSIVLAGSLRNSILRVSASGKIASPLVAIEKERDGSRVFEKTGSASLTMKSVRDYHAGQFYVVPEGEFHINECLSSICITLVRRKRSGNTPARVATLIERIHSGARERHTLTPEEQAVIETLLMDEVRRL